MDDISAVFNASVSNETCDNQSMGVTVPLRGVVITAILLLVIGAIPSNILITRAIGRTKYLPLNFRTMLQMLAICHLLQVVLDVMLHLDRANFFKMYGSGYCTFLTGSAALVYTLTFMAHCGPALERYVATKALLWNCRFIVAVNKAAAGLILGINLTLSGLTVFASHGTKVRNLFSDRNQSSQVLCTCRQLSSGPCDELRRILSVVTMLGVTIVVVAVLYLSVWRDSKAKLALFSLNTAQHSLQERFAFRVNLHITNTTSPIILLSMVVSMLQLLAFLGALTVIKLEKTGQHLYNMGSSALGSLYIISFPWLLIYRNEHIRKSFTNIFKMQQTTSEVIELNPGEAGAVGKFGKSGATPSTAKNVVNHQITTDEHLAIVNSLWGSSSIKTPSIVSKLKNSLKTKNNKKKDALQAKSLQMSQQGNQHEQSTAINEHDQQQQRSTGKSTRVIKESQVINTSKNPNHQPNTFFSAFYQATTSRVNKIDDQKTTQTADNSKDNSKDNSDQQPSILFSRRTPKTPGNPVNLQLPGSTVLTSPKSPWTDRVWFKRRDRVALYAVSDQGRAWPGGSPDLVELE